MFEKPWFEKFNKIADWIIRIVVINVFLVIFSIGIVTFYVGFRMAYELFKDYSEGENTPLFKGAWQNIKKDFWKNLLIGVIFGIIIVISVLNAYFYKQSLDEEFAIFTAVGYYVTIMVAVAAYLIAIYHAAVAHVYGDLKIKESFKLSFYLAGKYIFRTLLLMLVNMAPILLMMYQYTQPVFVLAGLSVPAIFNVLLTKKPVNFLKGEK